LKRLSSLKKLRWVSKWSMRLPSLSKMLPFCFIASSVIFSFYVELPMLLLSLVIGVTGISLLTRQNTDQVLNNFARLVGGWNVFFIALAAAVGLSLISHVEPAYALFDGAKAAASGGIGKYIGTDESTSLIDTITFGMWALAAVGGIATIAGGAVQNVMVLVGGLVLFFGMAVLIGVLEFTDGLLFST
jgi:hypothetical protein